jgi:hypothetical protein
MRNLSVALIATAWFALGQSQPPSPGPRKPTQNNQSKTARKQGEAPNYQSAANPVSAAINKLTSEVTAWKQQESAKQKEGDTSTDRWLMWSTIATAAATFAIAYLGYRQWRTLQAHHAVMNRQANYIRRALKQTKIAAKAALLNANLLISRERARLIVSDVHLANPADAANIFVRLELRNVGPSHAFDVEARTVCSPWSPESDVKQLRFAPEFLPLIEAGAVHQWIIIPMVPPISQADLDDIAERRGNAGIRVYGRFHFSDVFGKRRTLHVGYRLFVPPIGGIENHQWLLTEDPDDNRETEEDK